MHATSEVLPRWRPEAGRVQALYPDRGTVIPSAAHVEYVRRYSVHLGNDDGSFDYYGDPVNGRVFYVGDPSNGCASGGYGDRDYWRSSRTWPACSGRNLTDAGRSW